MSWLLKSESAEMAYYWFTVCVELEDYEAQRLAQCGEHYDPQECAIHFLQGRPLTRVYPSHRTELYLKELLK